jgi:hypothetical protein
MIKTVACYLGFGFIGGCAIIAFAIVVSVKALLNHNWRIVNSGDTRHIHMTKEEFDKLADGGS